MIKSKRRKIVFAPSDKINVTAHNLIERLFDIKGAFLSNESRLEDFMEVDSIPGHRRLLFSELSLKDQQEYRKHYQKFRQIQLKKLVVWYPPVTKREWKAIEKNNREKLVKSIARNYGVIIPEILDGETRIWRIVELIIKRLLRGGSKES